ncbi:MULTISPECIES: DUF397 domain-containing protein [unclassified Streptomyces]|uniref:DUF397 domain-containing protein n=2 Tax=Streptomyces TaxID=1883 RepID=UPI0038093EC4
MIPHHLRDDATLVQDLQRMGHAPREYSAGLGPGSHDLGVVDVRHAPAEPAWRSSSYSSGNGQCVEVGSGLPGNVPVRDSKTAPTGPHLTVEADVWTSFVSALKSARL